MERLNTPFPCEYDVIVAGGGPAGIAAAVSAARLGARTALVERYGILGGMLTSGHVQPILGHAQGRTMYDEIVELLTAGHEDVIPLVTRNGKEIGIDLEEAKYRLLKLCVDSGVYVYLQTVVADVLKEENRVTGVKICTPMGLQTLHAPVVVDSTGDGFVAALSGAPFEMGRASDGKCQPVTLEFTVDNVDESVGITAWGGSDPVTLPDGTKYSDACKAANARGELPENVSIVRLHRTATPGERNVNATQVNGRCCGGKGLLFPECPGVRSARSCRRCPFGCPVPDQSGPCGGCLYPETYLSRRIRWRYGRISGRFRQ